MNVDTCGLTEVNNGFAYFPNKIEWWGTKSAMEFFDVNNTEGIPTIFHILFGMRV